MLRRVDLTHHLESVREGRRTVEAVVRGFCERIDEIDPVLEVFVPEDGRRERLLRQAADLAEWDPDRELPLHGALVGVKDVIRVNGLPTRAGSELPPELLAGPQAAVVDRLRGAGALIAGKTVTAELAYLEPGPTRNPHDPSRTPGGSSSGSAAGVAAGLFHLALGTQTVGSTIRPAAYCGIVGFKPTFGRIPTEGLVAVSASLDTVGLFAQDVSGVRLAASVCCDDWRTDLEPLPPALGVPEGPYLGRAEPGAAEAFEASMERLAEAGYRIRRVPALADVDDVADRHLRLMHGEMARVHDGWFTEHRAAYRPRTAEAILFGRGVGDEELRRLRPHRRALADRLRGLAEDWGVDVWVSPAATGPAPEGLASTGDSAMNLPWTFAGTPVVTLPAGTSPGGLPLGLQCAAARGRDEELLDWAEGIGEAVGAR